MSVRARSLSAPGEERLDPRALAFGALATAVTVLLVVLGSSGLRWFDSALVAYLVGTLFAIFGVVYRYTVWLQRPPTARLHRRGWEAMWRRGRRGANARMAPGLVAKNLLGQTFIRKRSPSRWFAHQLIFWGCILAALVTFPLTFGWLHFESVGQDSEQHRAYLAGFGTFEFDSTSVLGFLIFHALDIAAFLVIAGVIIFLRRRLHDPGALAVERSNDFLALAGLFAVSITGLMLTVSSLWMDGRFYTFLTTTHALTVILGLMYIPFGKLFHIFQRPANIGVAFYKRDAAAGPQQTCRECTEPYASRLQVDDLKAVLPKVGFDYTLADGGNWQDVCPRCRRALFAHAQTQRVGGFG
ncbi:MAG: MFS transporter [Acidimicrobiia bacterium]